MRFQLKIDTITKQGNLQVKYRSDDERPCSGKPAFQKLRGPFKRGRRGGRPVGQKPHFAILFSKYVANLFLERHSVLALSSCHRPRAAQGRQKTQYTASPQMEGAG